MPHDDKKHPRDQGKFSKIPGGKRDPDAPPDPRDDARAQIKSSVLAGTGPTQPAQPMRDPMALRTLGTSAGRGYSTAQKAMMAMHASGNVQALQHHGRALQDAIKNLKTGGAKPEEIEKLRHGLGALHSALSQGDSVAAHEALTGLQHGFYHAHNEFRKEHGVGGFPPIGQQAAPQGVAEKAVEFGKKKAGQLAEGARGAADALWSAPKAIGDAAKKVFAPGKKQPEWKSVQEFKAMVDEIAARFDAEGVPPLPHHHDVLTRYGYSNAGTEAGSYKHTSGTWALHMGGKTYLGHDPKTGYSGADELAHALAVVHGGEKKESGNVINITQEAK